MKILYDHQIFGMQKYGGVSRYFNELITELNSLGISTDISLLLSNNYYISDNQFFESFGFLPNINFRGKVRMMSLVNKMNTINALKKGDFDIFHPTYYDTYFLEYIGNKPFVITVYDMIHEKYSHLFSVNNKTSNNKNFLCKKASKIIAISESTKNDLIDIFDISPDKIKVVYLSNSIFSSKPFLPVVNFPKKYILFVGERKGYKNFDTFIKSISSLLRDDPELFVVCVGSRNFDSSEIELFVLLGVNNRILHFNLSDEGLAKCYSQALMFVFPSLYEGFGIPILEAFACRSPLVCSNISPFSEVAQDGAEYFNPCDEVSIYNAVSKVINDKDRAINLVDLGCKRLDYFSWKKTAIETQEIYKGMLQ